MRPPTLFNRTNSMHMATSVSQRLNIWLCIMFKIVAFFIIKLFAWLYITRGKHVHDSIISLRREVWRHNTGLTPPPFFLKMLCAKPGKLAVMYLCVREYGFCVFLRFRYLILELFPLWGFFHFIKEFITWK